MAGDDAEEIYRCPYQDPVDPTQPCTYASKSDTMIAVHERAKHSKKDETKVKNEDELAENTFTSHSFNSGMFSSVKGNGSWLGLLGVGCLVTITSSFSSSLSLLTSLVRPYTWDAGRGQCSGTQPKFLRAHRDTSMAFTPSAKYRHLLVS